VGYKAAHLRIRTDRGPASDYQCIDCAGPAAEWSYSGNDASEIESRVGPYSLDPTFYDPRCVSCHRKHDQSRAIPATGTCLRGHVQNETNRRVGVRANGNVHNSCRPCGAFHAAQYQARKKKANETISQNGRGL